MTARERLSRYFKLVHLGSKLTSDEFHEMCHLEESLVDDTDNLYSDEQYKILWTFVKRAIELFCGSYAILETGSTWDVMEVLNEQMEKIVYKDRHKIQNIVAKPIACGYWEDPVDKIKYSKKNIRKK